MPYEIPSSIEVDGMDRVYLAGGKLDRDVAVKVLQITNGPGLVQQPCRLHAYSTRLLCRTGLHR